MGTIDKDELVAAFIYKGYYTPIVKATIESVSEEDELKNAARIMYTDAYPHRVYCSSCHKMIIPNMEWIGVYGLTLNYCPCCGKRFAYEEGDD